jgi:hypothetical protein
MELQQLIWVSAAVCPFSRDDLQRLLERGRTRNQARGITGILLYHKESFLQLMEGPSAEVEYVFENRIQKDPRHTDVTVLLSRTVAERSFPDWSMGFIDGAAHSLHGLPGFHDYDETWGWFLSLRGDHKVLDSVINGFHHGQWHKFGPGGI